MMMKKIWAYSMSVLLLLGLTACGNSAAATETTTSESERETSVQQTSLETESAMEQTSSSEAGASSADLEGVSGGEENQILVVYFSATGNTREAAEYIAQATGGDLFELEAADPYTREDLNYSDDSSRVVYEHDNSEAQNVELVADTVENWEEYETVFIGYPIWWHIAAWPVNDFVKANDFTGKTVIPFCTSASSGFGESGQLLEEMAGTGDWLEGERFSSSVTQETIQAWIDSLDL